MLLTCSPATTFPGFPAIRRLLLFRYLFGAAINAGTDHNHPEYLMPGILLIAIATGTSDRTYRLVTDRQSRHRRTVPLHADRPVIALCGHVPDLPGVHRHLVPVTVLGRLSSASFVGRMPGGRPWPASSMLFPLASRGLR